MVRESEVNNLSRACTHQDIGGFQVSVEDSSSFQIAVALKDIIEDSEGLDSGESALRGDNFCQLTALAVLGDDVEKLLGLKYAKALDYVGVVQFADGSYLVVEKQPLHLVSQAGQIDLFECDRLSCSLASALEDQTGHASADDQPGVVGVAGEMPLLSPSNLRDLIGIKVVNCHMKIVLKEFKQAELKKYCQNLRQYDIEQAEQYARVVQEALLSKDSLKNKANILASLRLLLLSGNCDFIDKLSQILIKYFSVACKYLAEEKVDKFPTQVQKSNSSQSSEQVRSYLTWIWQTVLLMRLTPQFEGQINPWVKLAETFKTLKKDSFTLYKKEDYKVFQKAFNDYLDLLQKMEASGMSNSENPYKPTFKAGQKTEPAKLSVESKINKEENSQATKIVLKEEKKQPNKLVGKEAKKDDKKQPIKLGKEEKQEIISNVTFKQPSKFGKEEKKEIIKPTGKQDTLTSILKDEKKEQIGQPKETTTNKQQKQMSKAAVKQQKPAEKKAQQGKDQFEDLRKAIYNQVKTVLQSQLQMNYKQSIITLKESHMKEIQKFQKFQTKSQQLAKENQTLRQKLETTLKPIKTQPQNAQTLRLKGEVSQLRSMVESLQVEKEKAFKREQELRIKLIQRDNSIQHYKKLLKQVQSHKVSQPYPKRQEFNAACFNSDSEVVASADMPQKALCASLIKLSHSMKGQLYSCNQFSVNFILYPFNRNKLMLVLHSKKNSTVSLKLPSSELYLIQFAKPMKNEKLQANTQFRMDLNVQLINFKAELFLFGLKFNQFKIRLPLPFSALSMAEFEPLADISRPKTVLKTHNFKISSNYSQHFLQKLKIAKLKDAKGECQINNEVLFWQLQVRQEKARLYMGGERTDIAQCLLQLVIFFYEQ